MSAAIEQSRLVDGRRHLRGSLDRRGYERRQLGPQAAIEDGSFRAETDAELDPKWVAQYGDAAWDAALVVSGHCAPWDPLLTHPAPRPHHAADFAPIRSPVSLQSDQSFRMFPITRP